MAGNRRDWSFDPNVQADLRGPRALEFIAHYLDGIDRSLDRIAEVLEHDRGSVEHLRSELKGVSVALSHGRK